jgi:heme-binding protein
MKKIPADALLGIAGCLLIEQFITIQRTNPPLKGDVAASQEIEAVLRRACYDYHSNETRWPWYSYIAPVSWLIARDVELGRRGLNFSEWGAYYPVTRLRKLQWINRAAHERTIPPWSYRVLHPGAGLTEEDLVTLELWIEPEIAARQQSPKTN